MKKDDALSLHPARRRDWLSQVRGVFALIWRCCVTSTWSFTVREECIGTPRGDAFSIVSWYWNTPQTKKACHTTVMVFTLSKEGWQLKFIIVRDAGHQESSSVRSRCWQHHKEMFFLFNAAFGKLPSVITSALTLFDSRSLLEISPLLRPCFLL